ncbi:MAG: GAF domain-containing protein [Ignavibacteria bacterium]|nr:MAG: GAF domain-containing protein [Ignavibacteria bacterium]
MSEEIKIPANATEEEIYKELLPQIESLIEPGIPAISNLSNITAVLKEAFPKISWVGFYLLSGEKLYLGPFQGKLACTTIEIGKGVCGTSALRKETVIVDDVDKFPGHIACDAGSRSEIVVPVIYDDKLYGVLDIDSYEYSSFNEIDKRYLEKILSILTEKIDFENLRI